MKYMCKTYFQLQRNYKNNFNSSKNTVGFAHCHCRLIAMQYASLLCLQITYIQKAGDPGDKSPPIFWIFRQFFAANAEPFKFALCLKTALPMFSKLCSDIA